MVRFTNRLKKLESHAPDKLPSSDDFPTAEAYVKFMADATIKFPHTGEWVHEKDGDPRAYVKSKMGWVSSLPIWRASPSSPDQMIFQIRNKISGNKELERSDPAEVRHWLHGQTPDHHEVWILDDGPGELIGIYSGDEFLELHKTSIF